MNWLKKIAIPIFVRETPDNIVATMDYMLDRYKWRFGSVAFQKGVDQVSWDMSFMGYKKNSIAYQPYYVILVSMLWTGEDFQYETQHGRHGLEFVVQVLDGNREPITRKSAKFETVSEMVTEIKKILWEDDGDGDGGDDDYSPTGDPQESAPIYDPTVLIQ